MADIRLATDFFDHPKTMMLQAKHGAESILNLERLWSWAAVNRPKGILRGMNRQSVSLAAKCSVEVVADMVDIGFIDESSTGHLKLHNWKKHQGYVYHSDERSAQAKKAANARYSKKSQKKVACSEHADSNAPVPDPDPSPIPAPKVSKTFVRPTIEDLKTYCKEKGYTFDPETFLSHYDSNGWKVGKNSMKKWESACVTWQKREKKIPTVNQEGSQGKVYGLNL